MNKNGRFLIARVVVTLLLFLLRMARHRKLNV